MEELLGGTGALSKMIV